MEQQTSFQIPNKPKFLEKFINFQDFPGHFARFQDIPGLSRKWEPCKRIEHSTQVVVAMKMDEVRKPVRRWQRWLNADTLIQNLS